MADKGKPKDIDASTSEAKEEEEAGNSSSIELCLRLDEFGRTTYDPQQALLAKTASSSELTQTDPNNSSSVVPANNNNDNSEQGCSKRAKIDHDRRVHHATPAAATLDYSTKTTSTHLASPLDDNPSFEDAMNDLLFDCEITDCGLLPRTFWVPATASSSSSNNGTRTTTESHARCYLERLALDIFHHHVPSTAGNNNNNNDFYYDPETSGAEWWVQLRPSPPGTGRYSMLANDNDDDDDDMAKSGISFHWDKDEDLRLMCGGSMHIHPHVSTVTYLTDLGAPTVVVSKRVDPMTGEHVVPETNDDGSSQSNVVEGYVSWPERGKHLSFDGRYLHAAPSDVMEEGLFERQCSYDVTSEMDDKTKKVLGRKHRRVTFLVNIWLNYKPFNVNPFPETMIEKLSKRDLFGDSSLFSNESRDNEEGCNEEVPGDKVVFIDKGKASISGKKPSTESSSSSTIELKKMKWSMGQKDEESIEVLLPVKLIQGQANARSDVAITRNDGVTLGGA